MPRDFSWSQPHHQKLQDALGDRIRPGTPLRCIWEDARIRSYADRSLKSFSICNEAKQAITKCLNGDQSRNLNTGKAVTVLGYNENGKKHKLKLKINQDGQAVLEGEWGSIMEANGWTRETTIRFWGFPYEGSNGGEPCFVFTGNNI